MLAGLGDAIASPAPVSRPTAKATMPHARVPKADIDAETLIRQGVGKLQNQGSAEADGLRAAMRRAIAILAEAAE
jgi:hypothetical protein